METKRLAGVSRGTALRKPTAKASAPPAKTVSASSVFKRPNKFQKVQKGAGQVLLPEASNDPPKKKRIIVHRKQTPHPLALDFEEATSDYRNTLLAQGTKFLDESHAVLVAALHDCNLVELSSPPASTESPIRLTLTAKFERAQQKLFTPIGDYKLRSRVKNDSGEKETVEITLKDMLAGFGERHLADVEQFGELQKQWETIVGEIWKTGVSCLGEDAMAELFLHHESTASNNGEDENSLFVSEKPLLQQQQQQSRASKKRVTFKEPLPEFPAFLTTPSQLKHLPRPPDLPRADMEALKKEVEELGNGHLAEMKAIDKEYQRFWERKLGTMRRVVEDDEYE